MLFLFLIYYEWSSVVVFYIHYFWNIFRDIHRRIAVRDLAFIGNAKYFPEVVLPVYTSNVRASLAARVNTCYHSVQLLSRVRLIATTWIAAREASLSITNSWSSLRLTYIKSVMPYSPLILSCPLLLLPPIPPGIRVLWVNSSHEVA